MSRPAYRDMGVQSAVGDRRSVLAVVLLTAALVLALDLGTKELVSRTMHLGEVIELVPGFLNLHHIKNSGAAFGIGNDWPKALRLPFFLAVIALAAGVLWSFYRRCSPEQTALQVALGLVSGGAVGNFVDRVLHGRVTDFIDVHVGDYHWPFFNVADSAITVGVVLLFVEIWLREKE